MHVALVTETYRPEINGVAITLGHVVDRLAAGGHRLTVFRPRQSRERGRPACRRPSGVTEVRVRGLPIPGYPLLRFGLPAGARLLSWWRGERPDVVHVATEGPLGWSALRSAQALGIPVTSSFHTNFHRYVDAYRIGWLEGLVARWLRSFHVRTLRTFVPTEQLASELEGEGYREVRVLSRGIDADSFAPARRDEALRAAWGAPPDAPVLLHVGRLAREKNYPLVLRAYAAMCAVDPRCRMVAVGDGPLGKDLRRENPDVLFPGFVDRDDLARHYASADVYVHASETETYGNVVAEALASGLAFVGFDYAAARCLVRDGENGVLVRPGDDTGFVVAAAGLVASPLRAARLRTAAPASVEGRSWDRVAARFAEDLREAIRVHRS